MNLEDLIKLVRKHLVILAATPVLLASLVAFFTRHPDFRFSSETRIFTGITTGSSVELDKSLNYFAAGTAFDNLINVIKSRKTQQEVAVRLLAQHLLLAKPDPKYLSPASFSGLHRITPEYVKELVDKAVRSGGTVPGDMGKLPSDSSLPAGVFPVSDPEKNAPLSGPPHETDAGAYERTVKALTGLMNSSDTNFVYRLLNFEHPHYSIKSISAVNVQRIGSSDMVQLKYETDDPGVCQQTLALMIDVCIHNYKSIRANQSDAVVKYFEDQLMSASDKLKSAEDKLLDFNMQNNIINYYEQSKAVAMAKESLDADYNNMRIRLAGIEAATRNLEEKLAGQNDIQLKSADLLAGRDTIGDLAYTIAALEAHDPLSDDEVKQIAALKQKGKMLENEIREKVNDYYRKGTTVEGLPVSTLLNDWIDNVIEGENTRAGLRVLRERIDEFQKQYSIYAPAGANVKRIEREISVSEGEYLEILHGLNLARLKMQDNELASNIKTVDPPYYPLSPNKTKRKMLVMMGAMAGFILVLSVILFLEYFDGSLNNPEKASAALRLKMAGMLPKIIPGGEKTNLAYVVSRLLDITLQNLEMSLSSSVKRSSPVVMVIFSCGNSDGKTVVAGNIARRLKSHGKKVLLLNYAAESMTLPENVSAPASGNSSEGSQDKNRRSRPRPSIIRFLLGYGDDRIDYDSPLFESPAGYLDKEEYIHYRVDGSFSSVRSYASLAGTGLSDTGQRPEYVIVELPPVLHSPVPVSLVEGSDIALLVCRATREWNSADERAIENIRKVAEGKIRYFLNGVSLNAVESVLGDLPKKRSWLRRTVKRIVRLQFYSENKF